MFPRKPSLALIGTALLVSLTFTGTALASWKASLDEAKAQAAAENKPVLIDFFADWCGPCKQFDAAAKEDKDIQKSLKNFVLVRIDSEKEDGKDLAEEFEIHGYPTYVVLNNADETQARWSGYEKKMFLARASEVTEDRTTIDEKMARYRKGPNVKDALQIGRYHDTRGEYARAISYFQAADQLGQASGERYLMEIFETTWYGARKDVFTMDELNLNASLLFSTLPTDPAELLLAADMMVSMAASKESPGLATPYVKKAVEGSRDSNDPDVVKARANLLPDYAILVENDPEAAVVHKKAIMKEGWMDDPDQLNAFAWWCFENKVNLEEAQTLAEKGAELAEPGPAKAMILDTMAEICNARDDCHQALEIMKRAAAEAPDKEHYQKQIKRFEGLLAEQGKK